MKTLLCRKDLCAVFLIIASAGMAFGQQDKGDKEIGLSGAGFFSHTSPLNGNLTLQGSIGYYLTQHQFLGATVGPNLSFGGGFTTGSVEFGGEYRYLLGHKNTKLWPFLGGRLGAQTSITKSNNSTTASTQGQAAPEVGVKYYASPKTSFEVSYQLQIELSGLGPNAGFADRSSSLFLLGFKHIF